MAPTMSGFCLQYSRLFKNIYVNILSRSKCKHHPGVRWFRSNSEGKSSGLTGIKRVELTPVKEPTSPNPLGFRSLLKPFLFTASVCGCSYVGATIWQYENVRKYAIGLSNPHSQVPCNYKHGYVRKQMNGMWNQLTEGQKLVAGIIAANSLVFLMWRIPVLKPAMLRYFAASPASKSVCLPMLLSTFSHHNTFHLAANMFVLYSFSNTAVNMFGKEQFLGFYLSAGVISSFTSYIFKVLTKTPNFSLGASGAIMGILAAVCLQFPDSRLSIILLPFFTFPAGVAIKCVMGLDAAGMILRWSIFDHAAHLGGSIFGAAYLWYGQNLVWRNREPILNQWHQYRNK